MNKQRWIILGGVGILILAAGGITAAVLYLNSDPEPPLLSEEEIIDQDPLATAKYMASEEFAKLPEEQKQKYLDAAISDHDKRREMFAMRDQLSDSEKKQLRKNMGPVFRNRMKKHIDEYHQLPPDQREAYLDKMIDQMEEMRQNTPPKPPRDSNKGAATSDKSRSSGHRGPSPARIKRFLESTTPADRAKMMQFMLDMRARMKARGIESPHHRRPR